MGGDGLSCQQELTSQLRSPSAYRYEFLFTVNVLDDQQYELALAYLSFLKVSLIPWDLWA